jgi:hypothetical protein
VGLTDSSDIIGAFSRANEGKVSVFALGTMQTANLYLLDLLSYSNRGDARIADGGRWGIPDSLVRLTDELARPVLTDIHFEFAAVSGCEAYPEMASHLYLDRPLVLYGRYPKTQTRLLFQAVGRAGDKGCDMVFDLPLSAAKSGTKDIRASWAMQRIYHLISRHAREPGETILREIQNTARSYGLRVPYRGKF